MESTEVVRVSKYWIKKASKHIGENKPFPSNSQFVSSAIQDKIEKLEKKK